MEITGQLLNINTAGERPPQLKEGESYRVKVESRLSDREAVISIRGQEVRATFSGPMPNEDRFVVQVESRTDDGIRVKALSLEEQHRQQRSEQGRVPEQQTIDRVLRDLGQRNPSHELRQAARHLLEQNIPLRSETVKDLDRFLEQGKGAKHQRLETVEMLAKKGLEPTAANLRSVHEALHGKNIHDQIRDIDAGRNRQAAAEPRHPQVQQEQREIMPKEQQYRESDRAERQPRREAAETVRALEQLHAGDRSKWPEAIRQIQDAVKNEQPEIRKMAADSLRDILQLLGKQQYSDAKDRISQLLQQIQGQVQQPPAEQSVVSDRSMLDSLQKTVQNEADLGAALEKIKENLLSLTVPKEVMTILLQGMNDAADRLSQGRELKARQVMVDAIQRAETVYASMSSQVQVADARAEVQQYMTNEMLQAANLSAKDILVTEVTERLAKATDEFKAFQREVTNQLTRIEHIIQQFRAQSVQQAKPMLENVIRQLDNALLKNDWLLFADMKTEKAVLQASSQLAEAKKLLTKGNHFEARQIVREVQQTLDKLLFKPSNQKIVHQLAQETELKDARPGVHRLSAQYDQTSRLLTYNQGSARNVFEGVRSLGLNREAELGQLLSVGKVPEEMEQRNLKALLLQTIRAEEDGSKLQQQAQQSLHHLTGQQLMSRTDYQQNMQMLMFQLPLLLKGAAENLQVFVNARNESGKLDWENCSLYFLIDTKKMGEVGISLNVTERALNVTLKNDDPGFKAKVEPLANKYLDKLKDIGFHVHGLHFSPLTPVQDEAAGTKTAELEEQVPTMTAKGFDYKI
ncbi:hypothetical protein SAMN05421736_102325 [Evansella caseinilytica]|uniref:Flagellar hook-length control protein FliK n=1 Tax=Evansella caseinilytica TaxID=1503961 RepID=A0A1H3L149_9BACI|nr:hypothetical protein [Evansella caseinilytica]SDY58133.1 hypothetical protein SAMN05421736_102325 [Evansella caseinilytica]